LESRRESLRCCVFLQAIQPRFQLDFELINLLSGCWLFGRWNLLKLLHQQRKDAVLAAQVFVPKLLRRGRTNRVTSELVQDALDLLFQHVATVTQKKWGSTPHYVLHPAIETGVLVFYF